MINQVNDLPGRQFRGRAIKDVEEFLASGAEHAEVTFDTDMPAQALRTKYWQAVNYHKLLDQVRVRQQDNRVFLSRV
jgi:hypothetical protein